MSSSDVQNQPLVPLSSNRFPPEILLFPPGSPVKPVVFVPVFPPHSELEALRALPELAPRVLYSALVGI